MSAHFPFVLFFYVIFIINVLNEVDNSTLLPENSCSSFVTVCHFDSFILHFQSFFKDVCANKTLKPNLWDCIWVLYFERGRLFGIDPNDPGDYVLVKEWALIKHQLANTKGISFTVEEKEKWTLSLHLLCGWKLNPQRHGHQI